MKKLLMIISVILFIIILSSCTRSKNAAEDKNTPEDEIKTVQSSETKINSSNRTTITENNYEEVVITDPIELEKLWQEYIYDAIPSVFNARNFNSVKEIDPVYIAEFCYFKYLSEYKEESLSFATKNSSQRLFPMTKVLEYASLYFNLTSLEVSELSKEYYDKEKKAFLFGLQREASIPPYSGSNAFGIELDKVTKNSDGTMAVILVRYDTYQTKRIELVMTNTFKQREDGSMYFVSGKWEYPNNMLVKLTGDYKRFDKINGFDEANEFSFIGESQGKSILASGLYNEKKSSALMLINMDTMSVEKKLELKESFNHAVFKVLSDQIFICLENKILVIDKNFEAAKEIPLPEKIINKINRKEKYDKNGNRDIIFGGYDVSKDLSVIVYTDETGVKLLNTLDGSEKVLAGTRKVINDMTSNRSYHWSPRFIANDKRVITSMIGYECSLGYTICDLENATQKFIDIVSEGGSNELYYDSGLVLVNNIQYNQKNQIEEYKTKFLDFKTGELNEINLEYIGETNEIRDPRYCYVGENYAAFVTYKNDNNDNAQNMSYINRLNIQTLKVEEKIISVKAARIEILGVLADGRIIFKYDYNPTEKGICITN